MSQTDYTMLHDVPSIRAAIGRGGRVEMFSALDGEWRPILRATNSDIERWLSWGIKIRSVRIASPSRQAAPADGLSEPQGSQVVSDGDMAAMCEAFGDYAGYEAGIRRAASALLARRPCAQGQGEPVAWLAEELGYLPGDGGRELWWNPNPHHTCWKQTPLYRSISEAPETGTTS